MPENLTTVLASSVGVTRAINLDWRNGGPVTVRVTTPSTVTPSAAGVLKYTLDDVQTTASSLVLWSPVSSTFGSTAAGLIITSSQLIDVSFIYSFQVPIAALRFDSSAFSSAGFRLDVMQGRSY